MKNLTFIALFYLSIGTSFSANNTDDEKLLNTFHKYGITECDNFILKNSPLKDNWNYFIEKHAGGLDGPTTEVSLIIIHGSKNDTVKADYSYIETQKSCYLNKRSIVTFPGSCDSNFDGDSWYVSTKMPNKDYTVYKHKNGLSIQAKEITLGNFKACIKEYSVRTKGNHG